MSAIKFINNVASAPMVEFQLFQGINRTARIGVHAGGHAAVPTTTEYSAQAFTSMGEFKLCSNPVNFTSSSIVLLAQVLCENGFYDFQLVENPGIAASAITCENTWISSVQFKLTRPNSPFQIVTVVDEHNYLNISTAQQWTCYAIANGITTPTVTISDPNGKVTAVANNNDSGVTLMVT